MRDSLARISRKASRTHPRNRAAIAASTGTASIENSAKRPSVRNITTTMSPSRTTSPSRLMTPDANISVSDSMSFVMRVISCPTGVRSKERRRQFQHVAVNRQPQVAHRALADDLDQIVVRERRPVLSQQREQVQQPQAVQARQLVGGDVLVDRPLEQIRLHHLETGDQRQQRD